MREIKNGEEMLLLRMSGYTLESIAQKYFLSRKTVSRRLKEDWLRDLAKKHAAYYFWQHESSYNGEFISDS
jgi:hypothetical protein